MSVYSAEFLKHIREHLSILGRKDPNAEIDVDISSLSSLQIVILFPSRSIIMDIYCVVVRRVFHFLKKIIELKRNNLIANPFFSVVFIVFC